MGNIDMTQPPDEPMEAIQFMLKLPFGLVRDFDALVDMGIHADPQRALPHAIVESWRHNRGSFHTLRLDLRNAQDANPGPASREAEEVAAS